MIADVNQAAEKRSGGQNDRPAAMPIACVIDHAHDAVIFHHQPLDQGLLEIQTGGVFQHAFHGRVVAGLVVLGTGRMNRRSLFGIQGAVLDRRLVGDAGHLSAQGIDLLDQLPLGHPADGGAAGHGGHLVQIDDHQQDAASHAGRRQRRFTSGMARADDDDIVGSRKNCHYRSKRLVMDGVLICKGSRVMQRYRSDAGHGTWS